MRFALTAIQGLSIPQDVQHGKHPKRIWEISNVDLFKTAGQPRKSRPFAAICHHPSGKFRRGLGSAGKCYGARGRGEGIARKMSKTLAQIDVTLPRALTSKGSC